MIHKYIYVKMEDGSYHTVDICNFEQILLDKVTGEITVWWKEYDEVFCAPLAYWEKEDFQNG